MSLRALPRFGLCVLAAVLLAAGGCAHVPWGTSESGTAEAFEAFGRVYVRYGPRAFSGTLRWRHAARADEVWLGGPLGQTAAHLVRDGSGAVLTTADQQVYRSTSIDALTREGLGWTLPLADLSYYVLGKVPQYAAPSAERDASGRLVSAVRDGWTVRWTPLAQVQGSERLWRIDLVKDEVEIRFVLDRLESVVSP